MNQPSSSVRSYELDFFKLIGAVMVAFCHTAYFPGVTDNSWFLGGSIFVDFFFITSGYLMARSIAKSPSSGCNLPNETFAFLKKKIGTFFPYMVFSFCTCLLAKSLYFHPTFIELLKQLANGLPELLLLKSSGAVTNLVNGPTWYLSAMVLSMAVLYPLLLKYGKNFRQLLCPLLALFIMGYLQLKYHHFRTPDTVDAFLYKGTIRGFAELCLGVTCYELGCVLSKFNFTRLSRFLMTVFVYAAFAALIHHTNSPTYWDMDTPSVLILSLCVIILSNGLDLTAPLFSKLKCSRWFGKFSLMLYLNHMQWVWVVSRFVPDWSYKRQLVLFWVGSVLSSLLCWWIVDLLQNLWHKHRHSLKALFILPAAQ